MAYQYLSLLLASACLGLAGCHHAETDAPQRARTAADTASAGGERRAEATDSAPDSAARLEEPVLLGPLHNNGDGFLRDSSGRVVILHGVNFGQKTPPYHPEAIGLNRSHAARLAEIGFNSVRLFISWQAVEPERKAYDYAYLDQIKATSRMLGEYGLRVLIDMHQDMYASRFQGNGHPDWAVIDDGIPAQPELGFPYNYFGMPALWRAYDNFWANAPLPDGVGLQDAYADMWRITAQHLADEPAIYGFEVMNEPFPGSQWPTCVSPVGCPAFDLSMLTPFSDKVVTAIRSVDPDRVVLYEPNVTFDFGADTSHGKLSDTNVGFSFHPYCLDSETTHLEFTALEPVVVPACRVEEQTVIDNAVKHRTTTGAAALITEFANKTKTALIERVADAADEAMIGWQFWALAQMTDQFPQEQPFRDDIAVEIVPSVQAGLSRAYPRAIAGTPQRYRFYAGAARFELEYTPDHSLLTPNGRDKARTEIYVPDWHYPDGYQVEVTGATVLSQDDAPIVLLVADAGVEQVRVIVTRSE